MTLLETAPPVPAVTRPPVLLRATIPRAARVIDFGRPLTAEDLWKVPKALGRQELVDGRLIEMPGVGLGHGSLHAIFGGRLGDWNRKHALGHVMLSTGFILARNSDLVRGPDISFIQHASLPVDQDFEDFIEAVPEFVVEVASKSDRPAELASKAAEYLAFGVAMVVVLDQKAATLTVYRTDGEPEVLGIDATFRGDEVLPGFACSVADLMKV